MHTLFGVRIDDLSSDDLKNQLHEWLSSAKLHKIFTPNPEFLLLARKDNQFAALLNQSDLSLADGVGLSFAIAAMTDNRLVHRQTGIDTLLLLAKLCAQKKLRILLFGGTEVSASNTTITLRQMYAGLDVVYIDPGRLTGGYKSLPIPQTLIDEIRVLKPDVMAVALGQGKQERFIINIAPHIPTLKIAIGIGGAFDTISGRLRRAPLWMRQHGFEWLWRVLIEPKRIRRIFRATVIFPIVVICDTLKHRRFWKALGRVIKQLL